MSDKSSLGLSNTHIGGVYTEGDNCFITKYSLLYYLYNFVACSEIQPEEVR